MRFDVRPRALAIAVTFLVVLAGVGALFAARERSTAELPRPPSVAPPAATVPVAPQAPPSAPAPAPRAEAPRRLSPPPAEDGETLEHLRGLVVTDPGRALALIAELDRRYPSSPLAEERASLAIDALVKLGDIGQARTNSDEYFARFPDHRFGLHIETLTGVHPHSASEEASAN